MEEKKYFKDESDIKALAMLIDGEGCFCIPLAVKTNYSRPWINVNFSVSIGQNDVGGAREYLNAIVTELKIGSLYEINDKTPSGESFKKLKWQTTNFKETLDFCRLVIPFLRFKRRIAERFFKVCKQYVLSADKTKRWRGLPTRPKGVMVDVINTSLEINSHVRQTKKHRKTKNKEYLMKVLDEVYSHRETHKMNKGGMPRLFTDNDLLESIKEEYSKVPVTQKTHKNLTANCVYRFGSWAKAKQLAFSELSNEELYLKKVLTPKEFKNLGVDTKFITRALERKRWAT